VTFYDENGFDLRMPDLPSDRYDPYAAMAATASRPPKPVPEYHADVSVVIGQLNRKIVNRRIINANRP
jgi:hypothetical protein